MAPRYVTNWLYTKSASFDELLSSIAQVFRSYSRNLPFGGKSASPKVKFKKRSSKVRQKLQLNLTIFEAGLSINCCVLICEMEIIN